MGDQPRRVRVRNPIRIDDLMIEQVVVNAYMKVGLYTVPADMEGAQPGTADPGKLLDFEERWTRAWIFETNGEASAPVKTAIWN
jgi:hypothetical protein